MKTAVKTSAAVDETFPCSTEGCKGEARLRLSATVAASFSNIVERIREGDIPMQCADCALREAEAIENAEEAGRIAELRRRRLTRSGIPEVWQDYDWDDIDVGDADRAAAAEALRKWGEGKGKRGLYIHGPVGVGKTRMAATAAVARLTVSGVEWMNGAEVIANLSRNFSDPKRKQAVDLLTDRTKRNVALVLDDLDKVPLNENAAQHLYTAIHVWYETGRPVLITANQSIDKIAFDYGERYGDALASRLAELCTPIKVGGRDRRIEP